LLLEGKLSLANQSLGFCVLSNAIGSDNNAPSWMKSDGEDSDFFLQLIDVALKSCDPTSDGAMSAPHVSLRQSAAAFLYNVSRKLAKGDGDGTHELSESTMSILIGCIENIGEEKDATTLKRRYLCIGQLLRSKMFGKTAIALVKDLGIVDGGVQSQAGDALAKEVSTLLY
jgi:hypothetical protein